MNPALRHSFPLPPQKPPRLPFRLGVNPPPKLGFGLAEQATQSRPPGSATTSASVAAPGSAFGANAGARQMFGVKASSATLAKPLVNGGIHGAKPLFQPGHAANDPFPALPSPSPAAPASLTSAGAMAGAAMRGATSAMVGKIPRQSASPSSTLVSGAKPPASGAQTLLSQRAAAPSAGAIPKMGTRAVGASAGVSVGSKAASAGGIGIGLGAGVRSMGGVTSDMGGDPFYKAAEAEQKKVVTLAENVARQQREYAPYVSPVKTTLGLDSEKIAAEKAQRDRGASPGPVRIPFAPGAPLGSGHASLPGGTLPNNGVPPLLARPPAMLKSSVQTPPPPTSPATPPKTTASTDAVIRPSESTPAKRPDAKKQGHGGVIPEGTGSAERTTPSFTDIARTAMLDNPTSPLSIFRIFEGPEARKERKQRMLGLGGQVKNPATEPARSYFTEPKATGNGTTPEPVPDRSAVSAKDLSAAPEWVGGTPQDRRKAINQWAKDQRKALPEGDTERRLALDKELDELHARAAGGSLEKVKNFYWDTSDSVHRSLAATPFTLWKQGEQLIHKMTGGSEEKTVDVDHLTNNAKRFAPRIGEFAQENNPFSKKDNVWDDSLKGVQKDILDRKLPEDPDQLYDALKEHGRKIADANAQLYGGKAEDYLPPELVNPSPESDAKYRESFKSMLRGESPAEQGGVALSNQSRSLVLSPENVESFRQYQLTRDPEEFAAMRNRLGRSQSAEESQKRQDKIESRRKGNDLSEKAAKAVFGVFSPGAGDAMVQTTREDAGNVVQTVANMAPGAGKFIGALGGKVAGKLGAQVAKGIGVANSPTAKGASRIGSGAKSIVKDIASGAVETITGQDNAGVADVLVGSLLEGGMAAPGAPGGHPAGSNIGPGQKHGTADPGKPAYPNLEVTPQGGINNAQQAPAATDASVTPERNEVVDAGKAAPSPEPAPVNTTPPERTPAAPAAPSSGRAGEGAPNPGGSPPVSAPQPKGEHTSNPPVAPPSGKPFGDTDQRPLPTPEEDESAPMPSPSPRPGPGSIPPKSATPPRFDSPHRPDPWKVDKPDSGKQPYGRGPNDSSPLQPIDEWRRPDDLRGKNPGNNRPHEVDAEGKRRPDFIERVEGSIQGRGSLPNRWRPGDADVDGDAGPGRFDRAPSQPQPEPSHPHANRVDTPQGRALGSAASQYSPASRPDSGSIPAAAPPGRTRATARATDAPQNSPAAPDASPAAGATKMDVAAMLSGPERGAGQVQPTRNELKGFENLSKVHDAGKLPPAAQQKMREMAGRIAPGVKDPEAQQAISRAYAQHPREAKILQNLGPAVREGRKLHPDARAAYERANLIITQAFEGKIGGSRASQGMGSRDDSYGRLHYKNEYMALFVPEPIEDLIDQIQKEGFNVVEGTITCWNIDVARIEYNRNATRRWEMVEEWLHGKVALQGFLQDEIQKLAKTFSKKTRLPSGKWIKIDRERSAEEILIKEHILETFGDFLDQNDRHFIEQQINQISKYGIRMGY